MVFIRMISCIIIVYQFLYMLAGVVNSESEWRYTPEKSYPPQPVNPIRYHLENVYPSGWVKMSHIVVYRFPFAQKHSKAVVKKHFNISFICPCVCIFLVSSLFDSFRMLLRLLSAPVRWPKLLRWIVCPITAY